MAWDDPAIAADWGITDPVPVGPRRQQPRPGADLPAGAGRAGACEAAERRLRVARHRRRRLHRLQLRAATSCATERRLRHRRRRAHVPPVTSRRIRDVDDDRVHRFVEGRTSATPGPLEDGRCAGHDAVVHLRRPRSATFNRSIVERPDALRSTREPLRHQRRDGHWTRRLDSRPGRRTSAPTRSTARSRSDPPRRPTRWNRGARRTPRRRPALDPHRASYHRTYGLPVSVTRCTNNFGPTSFRRRRFRSSPPTCSTAARSRCTAKRGVGLFIAA